MQFEFEYSILSQKNKIPLFGIAETNNCSEFKQLFYRSHMQLKINTYRTIVTYKKKAL